MKQTPPPRIQISSGQAGPTLMLVDNLTDTAPAQATRVTLSRTENHFCVTFECEDTEPWATITERDGLLYKEEVVELFLDPFGDLECYFEIEVNPLNAVLDLVLRRSRSGYRKDFAWRCEGLETSVVQTPAGWSVTLSIPFLSLRPDVPVEGSVWRVNFLRIDRPAGSPRQLSAWSPTLIDNFHVPEQFGFLEF